MLPVEVHDVPLDMVVTESAVRPAFRNSGSASTLRAMAESAAFRSSGGMSALSFRYSLRSDFLSIEQSLLEESASGGTVREAKRICPNALDSGTAHSVSRRKVQHFHILLLALDGNGTARATVRSAGADRGKSAVQAYSE